MQRRITYPIEERFLEMRGKGVEVTPANIQAHVGIGRGAAVGLAQAHQAVEIYRRVLGDNLVAAVVFGAVGRGFPKNRLPKDIDLLVITDSEGARKATAEDILASMPTGVSVMQAFQKSVRETIPQQNHMAMLYRCIFSLPHVCMHGSEHVQELRTRALEHLKESDFDEYIRLKMDKRRQETAERGGKAPPDDQLRQQVIDDFGVAETLDRARAFRSAHRG